MKTPWIRDLAGAWVFYSVLPQLPWPKPSFKRIARFAPVIGLIIGGSQAILWLILNEIHWPKESLTLIVLALGAWMTGGLHFDGLMDTADGLAAGQERCLEAMKDSRVGASGITSFTIVLLIQIAALLKLESLSIIALPVACFWSRCSALWAIGYFPYLNKLKKESFHHKNWQGTSEIKPALIIILISLLLMQLIPLQSVSTIKLFSGVIAGIIPTILIPHLLGTRLKGHNGDSFGASVVLVETFMLLALAIILPAG